MNGALPRAGRPTVWLREASPERSVGGNLSWTDSPGQQRRDRRDSFSTIAPSLAYYACARMVEQFPFHLCRDCKQCHLWPGDLRRAGRPLERAKGTGF